MRKAVAEGHGDTAVHLLLAGAEADRKDVDGHTAIELAPDDKVCGEHEPIGAWTLARKI